MRVALDWDEIGPDPTESLIHPCLCGHEKGDHQKRLGQRGNYTPCCAIDCKCDGFRRMSERPIARTDDRRIKWGESEPPLIIVTGLWERLVDARDGCLEWTGAKDRQGYGRIQFSLQDGTRTTGRVHRIAWIVTHREIPSADWCVCHHCDNPSCANPEHLFLGTRADNFYDSQRKGRVSKYAQTRSHCKHGHELTIENSYLYVKRGRQCRDCLACRKATNARRPSVRRA